jgi:hypothetical protein
MGESFTMIFCYNWNRKSVAYQIRNGGWRGWDNCHAEGNPLIPLIAETAFVSACNTRFYSDIMKYSPFTKKLYMGIEEVFYRTLQL